MKRLALVEVILGLAFVAFSSFFMLESATGATADLHGYLLGAAIFGTGLGALLAFAGVVLHSSLRFGALAHIPFFAYAVASYVTFFAAYA